MIDRPVWARWWFGVTAAFVLVGLVVQAVDTARLTSGHFATPLTRTLNILCFFTIESNVLVLVSCALLAWRLEGWGTAFAVVRTAGLVGITITGVVYYAVLKDLLDLRGAAWVADQLLHTVSPLMAVLGWLLFGPRRLVTRRVAGLVLVYPVAFLALTLIRGPIVHWYPYPFLDVMTHGYAQVVANSVVVAVLVLAVAFGAAWLDPRLAARTVGSERSPAGSLADSAEP